MYGNASILFKDMIQSELKNNAIFIENENCTDATHIGLASYRHYQDGKYCSSNELKPMYLKKSSAEV